jgi:hypothetical protein
MAASYSYIINQENYGTFIWIPEDARCTVVCTYLYMYTVTRADFHFYAVQ